jgi:hypothetical protein
VKERTCRKFEIEEAENLISANQKMQSHKKCLWFQTQQHAKKNEHAQKESKKDDSVLSDLLTSPDSEFSGESSEVSQGILNFLGNSSQGLLWNRG